jgi:predicted TIM-barrel fold metal-dependent hydrolase
MSVDRVHYPLITPDRWLADFADLEIKPAVRPLILKDNAACVLGLGKPG